MRAHPRYQSARASMISKCTCTKHKISKCKCTQDIKVHMHPKQARVQLKCQSDDRRARGPMIIFSRSS